MESSFKSKTDNLFAEYKEEFIATRKRVKLKEEVLHYRPKIRPVSEFNEDRSRSIS